ncbi:MAB_1171c family putative transporter [Nocardia suismassiliense]|uniref:MAB_1171c family putative transporter n=1 Tax=Nocardia suismassiliense TaxID=2077092 RepID=UPI000D1E7FE1|nr:MAB_1171c family putative transporter [Nocardia suismassiliense]
MSSPVPAVFAVPVIVFVVAVALGRFAVLNTTAIDRLLNRALAWTAVSLVLLERGIAPQFGSVMHQLSMGATMLAIANIYGAATLWADTDPRVAARRQRYYDLAAVAAVGLILIIGTPYRRAGTLLGQDSSWQEFVVSAVMWIPLIAAGRLVWRVGLRELRTGQVSRYERAVFTALLAAPVIAGASLVSSIARHTGRWNADDPHLTRWAAPNFGTVFVLAAMLAVPLAELVSARAGWDRSGRRCRRLRPLWSELTAAVPEIVLPASGPAPPDARLLRMTVEIRDALMHLHRYLPAEQTTPGPPSNERYARQLRQAITAKRAGAAPAAGSREADRFGTPSSDLDSDIRRLLELARAWRIRETRTIPTGLTKLLPKPSRGG